MSKAMQMLNVTEVADRLRISPDHVRDMIRRRQLAAIKIGSRIGTRGGRYRIPDYAVEEWLAANIMPAKAQEEIS